MKFFYHILFLSLTLTVSSVFSIDINKFPLPPKSILSKYEKDQEIANCITVGSEKIHWRNRYKKIGVKYFSQEELDNLVVTVNAQGLLTYKGIPLAPGSYEYILSQEGKLLAFLRKNRRGSNLNSELTQWFKNQTLKDPSLFVNASTKEPLFYRVICKHSSLSHGHPVLCVGDFSIETEGAPSFFSNNSGHYRLKSVYMKNLAYYLNAAGLKDCQFHLFYKNAEKKMKKHIVSLRDVLNASEDDPIFNE